MLKLFILTTCLILHGSLYPYDFYAQPLTARLIEGALNNWPVANRYLLRDLLVNVVIYIPLGGLAFLFCRERRGAARSIILATASGLLLSTTVEFVQLFDRGRTSSIADICYNVAGTGGGIWLAASLPFGTKRRLTLAPEGLRAPEAAVLLALWALHQLYPLLPSLSLYILSVRLRGLLRFAWTWTDVFVGLAIWIGIAMLVKAVFSDGARRLFLGLLLTVPFRLFVAGTAPTVSQFLSAALACTIALLAWRRLTPEVAAVSLLASVAVHELFPFYFLPQKLNGFVWVPFGGSLNSDWFVGLSTVLGKSIHSGIAAWSVWACRRGWTAAATSVGGILAVGEFLQMWLPGRTPEVTDPLLAVLMVLVLRTVQQRL